MAKEEEKGNLQTCESCGKDLFCGAKTGNCWCFDITLESKTLAEIREKYEKCLCANCLKNKTESAAD